MKSVVKALKWLVWIAVLCGACWYGWHRWQVRKASRAERVVASYGEVRRGPLLINLIESGTIKPQRQHVIKSQVEGRASITYIVSEGERVKKGQLLFKLDSSDFEDKLANQEILAKNAEANLTQARENLEVVKNQAKADVTKAELDLRFAKEDLVKYKAGEYPKTLNEAETRVTLAAEELKRAKDKLEWSTRLYQEKYLSESDYRTDALSCKRYELELKSAENALNLLKEYTYKREVATLESDVEQKDMALDRARRKANADVTQATAVLNARELELKRQTDQVEKLQSQIKRCTVTSPADGLVIYANSNDIWRKSDQNMLQVGTEVFHRQDLINLPEGDEFKAVVKVHETNLKKVQVGMPVRITVDALKDVSFSGKVVRVAPLPDAQSMFMNPDLKLYDSEVMIEDSKGMLKSGMNCRAEIMIEQLEDAVYVPLQSVVREGGQPMVYLKTRGADERRQVEIGLDNGLFVHVKSGLKDGEQVNLAPPLDRADAAMDRGKRGGKKGFPGKGPFPPGMKRPGGAFGGGKGAPQGGFKGGPQGMRPQGGFKGGPQGMRPQGGRPQGPIPAGKRPAGASNDGQKASQGRLTWAYEGGIHEC